MSQPLAPIWQALLARVKGGPLPIHGPIEFTPASLAAARHTCGPSRGVVHTDFIFSAAVWDHIRADSSWALLLDLPQPSHYPDGLVANLFGARVWVPGSQSQQVGTSDTFQLLNLPDLIMRDANGVFYFYEVRLPENQSVKVEEPASPAPVGSDAWHVKSAMASAINLLTYLEKCGRLSTEDQKECGRVATRLRQSLPSKDLV